MAAEKPAFREPKIRLNRIYTRSGDEGETSLVGGQRLPKHSLRIECYGAVDELNAVVGLACVTASSESSELAATLKRIQHELFNLGSILATLPQDVGPRQPRIVDADVERLEREIDAATARLPELRSFVLPGGCRLSAELHLCRTVCRRAERVLVALAHQEPVPGEALRYLNRLSDAFFVWSRLANYLTGNPEIVWQPNQTSQGS